MKVVIEPGAYIPERAHSTDAGLDLRAKTAQTVPAHGSAVFDTGVHVQLPPNTAGILLTKSGINVKHNITSTCLIDEGYTGEIIVKLYNHGSFDYCVKAGDKISQLVIAPVKYEPMELVTALEDTERGSDGFGSTGK